MSGLSSATTLDANVLNRCDVWSIIITKVTLCWVPQEYTGNALKSQPEYIVDYNQHYQ